MLNSVSVSLKIVLNFPFHLVSFPVVVAMLCFMFLVREQCVYMYVGESDWVVYYQIQQQFFIRKASEGTYVHVCM